MMDSHRDEIAKLESLYASNPEGRVFTHLAEACRKAGQLERAREILEDGLRRHPDYASAHVVLGRVLSDSGDSSTAAHEFRRVLELDRHNLVALRSLGDLARAGDRSDEALYYYGELAVLDPTDGGIQEEIRRLRAQVAVAAPAAPESTAPAQPASEPPAPVAKAPVEATKPASLEPERFPASSPAAESSSADRPSGWSVAETAGPESVSSAGIKRMEGLEGGAAHDEPVSESTEAVAAEPGEMAAAAAETAAAQALAAEPVAAATPAEPVPEAVAEAATPEGTTTEAAAEAVEARPDSTWDLGETAWPRPRPPAAPEAERRADLGDSGEWIPAERWEWMAASADADVADESAQGVSAEAGTEPAAEALAEESAWEAAPAGDEEESEPEPAEPEGIDTEMVVEFSSTVEVSEYTIDVPLSPEAEEEAVGDYGMSDDDEGDLVITETLAEIYATQGLFERAAAVYRRLLRQRPGDERLAARLRELEKAPTWSGSAAKAEPEPAGPTIAEAGSGESWLERVESAWTGGEGAVSAEESPYSWPSERGREEPAGQRVGDYFRSLLSWRPGVSQPGSLAAEPEEPVGGTLDEDPATSFDQWFGGRDSGVGERAGTPEPGLAAGGDGDEDLEMFRSWLKSLKK